MRGNYPNSRQSAWLVAAMLAMIAIPAGITLHTVRQPAAITIAGANPTPHGYSWSLLLFALPIVVIGGWFLPGEQVHIAKRAFGKTLLILVPIGFGLDFFFAHRFFTYSNAGATLGVGAPALGGPIPVEEYIFYFTGFLAVLLIYIWLDEYWMAAYSRLGYDGEAKLVRRLFGFHLSSLLVGLALIVAAILYKKYLSPFPQGFPGYFIVLVIGSTVPSAGFFKTARPFINWRAFSLTLFMILLISLFWEATLAVPYGWWGYQPGAMLGLFIGAWAGLPIEAVLVWISVTYATTIIYEVLKIATSRKSVAHDAAAPQAAEPEQKV
ncbi:MAG TPA: hypothetical protein VHX20_15350 [Terracidiphilus sp.]|jgi:hypothetical protein|nr:hypothetical protein [Terracidiphilus sp.]